MPNRSSFAGNTIPTFIPPWKLISHHLPALFLFTVVHLKCGNVVVRRPAWVGGWGGSPRGGCCSLSAGLAMMGSRPCTSAAREICGVQRSKFTRRGSLDRSRAIYIGGPGAILYLPLHRSGPTPSPELTEGKRRVGRGAKGRRRACLRGPTAVFGRAGGAHMSGKRNCS
jgi:hypothetical protein